MNDKGLEWIELSTLLNDISDKEIDKLGFRLSKDDAIEDETDDGMIRIETHRLGQLILERVFHMSQDANRWVVESTYLMVDYEEDKPLNLNEMRVISLIFDKVK